tara:strand:+ start:99 stop:653 length:555 start_codon:yes stop_codon:yes gene_type:complete
MRFLMKISKNTLDLIMRLIIINSNNYTFRVSKEITIYFGTMSGNSEELADKSKEFLTEKNHNVSIVNLEDATPDSLTDTSYALFIVSTWGEGEPPVDAEDFFEALQGSEIDLKTVQYGIMGLGDTAYELFNEFARQLDQELERLGAIKITDRVEADVDYEDDFDSWIAKVAEIWAENAVASVDT